MLVCRSNSLLAALLSLACLLTLSAALVAQAPGAPSTTANQPAQANSGSSDPVSLFPHSETGRYWISGQANSIFQMHGHFHSPYQGPHSLIDDFETKASEVATCISAINCAPTHGSIPI